MWLLTVGHKPPVYIPIFVYPLLQSLSLCGCSLYHLTIGTAAYRVVSAAPFSYFASPYVIVCSGQKISRVSFKTCYPYDGICESTRASRFCIGKYKLLQINVISLILTLTNSFHTSFAQLLFFKVFFLKVHSSMYSHLQSVFGFHELVQVEQIRYRHSSWDRLTLKLRQVSRFDISFAFPLLTFNSPRLVSFCIRAVSTSLKYYKGLGPLLRYKTGS